MNIAVSPEKTLLSSSGIPDRLFIFEMANNHMGDVDHGIRIIREMKAVAKDFDFNFAFKLQYRQLETFIHPDYQGRADIKYIKRFSETRLSRDSVKRLVAEIKECGFIGICTPFDEASVDVIGEDGFDILKIASCSFTDWPLLEKIGASTLPVIGSTAGIQQDDIDNVVAFLSNRHKDFVLMHCVAEYPTEASALQLNQIDHLKARYPGLRIGYSTHEAPDAVLPVAIAISKGAIAFEKHVGVPTEQYSLNAYSANPEQVRHWLAAARDSYAIMGLSEGRIEPSKSELDSLIALRRAAFAKRDIAPGERIRDKDVFFAIPTQDGSITANEWSKYVHYYAAHGIKAKEPILSSNSRKVQVREKVYGIVQRVKAQLESAKVVVPGKAELEISHHYGLDSFDEFGLTMITVVNRHYCKKLICVLPGQQHPEQYHRIKEETFHVLWGKLLLKLDDVEHTLGPGAVVTIETGVKHAFAAPEGCVFEEISSTHEAADSFYTDPRVAENKDRKTHLTYWID